MHWFGLLTYFSIIALRRVYIMRAKIAVMVDACSGEFSNDLNRLLSNIRFGSSGAPCEWAKFSQSQHRSISYTPRDYVGVTPSPMHQLVRYLPMCRFTCMKTMSPKFYSVPPVHASPSPGGPSDSSTM